MSHNLSKRLTVGTIAAMGALIVAMGTLLSLFTISLTLNYLGAFLPDWLLIGIGIGLALPTIIASATADLPEHQTATGSAIVNMFRQVGTVLGTSILVVLLGGATSESDLRSGFVHAWWFVVALSLACAIAALGITPRRRRLIPTAEMF